LFRTPRVATLSLSVLVPASQRVLVEFCPNSACTRRFLRGDPLLGLLLCRSAFSATSPKLDPMLLCTASSLSKCRNRLQREQLLREQV